MNLFPTLTLFLLLLVNAQAEYARVEIKTSKSGNKKTMHLYLFDSRKEALKIIEQGTLEDQPYRNLAQAMKAHQCTAGCNGGFFGKNGEPLGLVIADGKKYGHKNLASSLTSAVVGQASGAPFIQRSRAYFQNGTPKHQQVLQSGPMLVENGKSVSGLSNKKNARRTIIFTDGKHRWGIAYAPSISLALLAEALADSKTFAEFNIKHAINLDGGSSSGFWVRRDNNPFYLREFGSVRNFVGVVPKK